MVEAVIFEMDVVIIGSHKVAFDLLMETANNLGANVTKNEKVTNNQSL